MVWEDVGENKGIWTERQDSETGESSIKEHKLKEVWRSCAEKDHIYKITGNREATCKKCGALKIFVVGKEIFKDGKFIPRK